MRILRDQHPAAQALKIGMGHNALHQPLGKTASTPRLQNKDIGQVGKGGTVSDRACKTNLALALEDAKAERVLNGSLDGFQRDSASPIAICQEVMHRTGIKARRISADLKFAFRPGVVHQAFSAAECSSFSMVAIFSTRRSWRPPANGVASHLSTMRRACCGLRMRAPNASTFALLCSRLI